LFLTELLYYGEQKNMLRIRLARGGKKRQPSYRIVVAESTSPRDGRFVDQIGFYNPMTNPETYRVNEARALHWLSVGAQPSEAVERLLKKQGTYERLQRFHAGEPQEKLMAEYEGLPWPPVAEVVEEAAPTLAGRASAVVEEAAEAVIETAADFVADVAESVSDAVETVVDAVAETVQDVTEAVENTIESVSEAVIGADDSDNEEAAA
jgi:small subunit ribosomal protein S16